MLLQVLQASPGPHCLLLGALRAPGSQVQNALGAGFPGVAQLALPAILGFVVSVLRGQELAASLRGVLLQLLQSAPLPFNSALRAPAPSVQNVVWNGMPSVAMLALPLNLGPAVQVCVCQTEPAFARSMVLESP